jgi:uncharacterized protein YcbK (DUF882 family)
MASLESLGAVLSTIRSPRILIGVQACRCCGRGGVDPRLIAAVLDLAELLGQDLTITSGYRCQAHNAAVGGDRRSKHMAGAALDIAIPDGVEPIDYYRAAMEVQALKRGGIGVDPQRRFVHHDFGAARRWAYHDRKQVAWEAVFPREH